MHQRTSGVSQQRHRAHVMRGTSEHEGCQIRGVSTAWAAGVGQPNMTGGNMAVLNDFAVDTAMNSLNNPPLTRFEMLMVPAALAYSAAMFLFVMAYDQWLARDARVSLATVTRTPQR